MKNLKHCYGQALHQPWGFMAIRFSFTVFWMLIFVQLAMGYQPATHDRFYIPNINDASYKFDGEIKAPEWNSANWFTFGTEGNPEVTVFARHKDDSLFLAFRIDFDSLMAKDMLTICIDPFNSGGTNPSDPQLRFDIALNGASFAYSNWNPISKNWTQQTTHDFITSSSKIKTYQNTNKKYFEAEVRIDCSDILPNSGEDFFGLYFLVMDFITSTDYHAFWWPKLANPPDITNLDPPLANQWANGIFVTGTISTMPDIFFNCYQQHLRTSNENDLTILPEVANSIKAKVHNIFFPGNQPNGDVQNIKLTFYYRDFGLGQFMKIEPAPPLFNLGANSNTEIPIVWTAPSLPPSLPDTVSLRAELILANDPITCNNSTRRTMQYLKVEENQAVDFTFSVQNSNEAVAFDNSPVFYASASPLPLLPENPNETSSSDYLYFFLDRSGLDPSIPDSVWDIKFALLTGITTQDTLVYLSDRDSVWYGPTLNTTNKFLLHFTAPEYESLAPNNPGSGCFLWRWLKQLFGSRSFSYTDSTISTLQIKVTRKEKSVAIGDTVYTRMAVLGYTGAYIQVVPTTANIWDTLKWIVLGIVAVVSGIYLYVKKRVKPKKLQTVR